MMAWGSAGVMLFVALVVAAVVRDRADEPRWADMGVIDRVVSALRSKEVLTQWWQVGGMWLCALLVGWYLVKRDARKVVTLMRFSR